MSSLRIAGFMVAGVGIAGFAVFAGTGGAASSDYTTLQKGCTGHCTDPKYDSVIQSGRTLEKISNVGLVAGIVGVVGGGALVFFGGTKSAPAKASAGLSITPQGGSLQYRVAF